MRFMHSIALSLLCVAPSTAALAAQDPQCPRGRTVLSSGRVTTSFFGFQAWKVATAKQDLPGNPAANIAPTASTVHAVWADMNASSDMVWRYLRSTDGGWSWNKANAVDIWVNNTVGGESFDAGGEMTFHAFENTVWVLFTSTRDSNGQPNANANDYAWVVASADQGQTWQSILVTRGTDAPLSTGDQLNDVDEPRGAVAKVVTGPTTRYSMHVIFEGDYQFAVGTGTAATNENAYYNRVDLDPVTGNLSLAFPEERRVDAATPSGMIDEDSPGIAAQGTVAVMTWLDDRLANGGLGGLNSFQNTYARITLDDGMTLGAEIDTTQLTTQGAYDYRAPFPVLQIPNIFVISEDSRNTLDDDLFMSFSLDLGQSWTRNVRLDTVPAGVDSDRKDFTVDGVEIFVSWHDDREGAPNVDNDIRGAYGTIADFVNGTQTEVDIQNTSCNASHYPQDRIGNLIVQSLESGCGEDSAVAWSVDGGRTWDWCETVGGGNADTDDPIAAVTLNRDIISITQQDDGLGNNNNKVEVNGLRVPRLLDKTATGGGLQLVDAFPGPGGDAGDVALLVAALAAPTSGALPLPRGGPVMNFTPDALTLGVLSNVPVFIQVIDQQGTATWPFPNFAKLIALPIHYAVATIDTGGTARFTTAFTDAITQR